MMNIKNRLRVLAYRLGERLMSRAMAGTSLAPILDMMLTREGMINQVNASAIEGAHGVAAGRTGTTFEAIHAMSIRQTNIDGSVTGGITYELMMPCMLPERPEFMHLIPVERAHILGALATDVLKAEGQFKDDAVLAMIVRQCVSHFTVASGDAPPLSWTGTIH